MRRVGLASLAVAYWLICSDHAVAEEPMHGIVGTHASLAAYPGAVISLKDPRSGMIFYVESNGRRLVGLTRDGRVLWGVDVLAAAEVNPDRGQVVIRHLRLDGNELWVTCGKSVIFKVQIENGKIKYFGSD